jgi:hypothetical protein
MTEPEIPSEPDAIASRLVIATIVASIVAIAASAVVVWLLASRISHGGGRSDHVFASEPPPDPFSLATAHEARRAAQLRALESYEWADAQHTRARIPLSLAIDRYLRGAK